MKRRNSPRSRWSGRGCGTFSCTCCQPARTQMLRDARAKRLQTSQVHLDGALNRQEMRISPMIMNIGQKHPRRQGPSHAGNTTHRPKDGRCGAGRSPSTFKTCASDGEHQKQITLSSSWVSSCCDLHTRVLVRASTDEPDSRRQPGAVLVNA